MKFIVDILLWGTLVGIIHFIVIGILYQNPFVAKLYKNSSTDHSFRSWNNQVHYTIAMFLGTQIEVYILSIGYFLLMGLINITLPVSLIIAAVFTGIRVYPRFWNMWIQTNYPRKLLAIEIINGSISTFIIILFLYFLTTIGN